MIPFNKPCITGDEEAYIQQVIRNQKLSGKGEFGKKCTEWLENRLGCEKALLTPSCTHALEMTALLTDIQEGDEVIMPSYTFVSTANAFVLRGASIRFVDISADTMNIDPTMIKKAITEKTKAIVVVHYAGVACDMGEIMDIANSHDIWVIEDAAQALLSTYKGRPLGTIGHFGTFSFHETKNYTCGEGGALIINSANSIQHAEIIQEKGTDRSQFLKGMIDKYTWQDVGSSYLLSDLNAAYLYAQFENADSINEERLRYWEHYKEGLQPMADRNLISTPHVPEDCQHNAHMFYIKTAKSDDCDHLRAYLDDQGIMAVPHYVPLHPTNAGETYSEFYGEDKYTTSESEKILRLPLYYGMGDEAVAHVVERIHAYYEI
ncbi:dTDP-4-amino-4,6-dideoxygalactose transaminase [Alkalihalobacillus sp. TS-13]|uniref:dTDP-4-amino-4,6-dideoxygalactose transaminase n=1 Tax=Alkalihalobacillus sp. TS-13 TaxID=2842455 RepID=UPI001C88AA51|nr:dTDP-4-amino-4,6-dideoxygalactose transaminase [Alkalihalobacillus sp. TS-13]